MSHTSSRELFTLVTRDFKVQLRTLTLDYENHRIPNDLPLQTHWTRLIDRSRNQADYHWTGDQLLCMRIDCFFRLESLRLQTYKRITEHIGLLAELYPECFRSPWEIDRAGMDASMSPCVDWLAGHVAMLMRIMEDACNTLNTVRDGIWGLETATQWRLAMAAWRALKEDHEEKWDESRRELSSGWFETAREAARRAFLLALLSDGMEVGAHYADPGFHWDDWHVEIRP